jgi:hypothetical protein
MHFSKKVGLSFREISLKFPEKFLKTSFLTKSHETYVTQY